MAGVLPYRVPGLGQETSPALTRRVATWQGRARVTEVRARPHERAEPEEHVADLVHPDSRSRAVTRVIGRDCGEPRSGEADVQHEVPEPQVEDSASGPVHNERQQNDGQDDDDHPEEEHDDTGNGIPGYGSGSSHGPPATRRRRL